MAVSIRVANAQGYPIGEGEIFDVASVGVTHRLSKAGDVRVSIPAAHPLAGLIHKYARLEITADYAAGQQLIATGIVDHIDIEAGDDGLLTASGGDLLRELQFTTAKNLLIHEIATVTASRVEIINPGPGPSHGLVPEATDGNPATVANITLGPAAWLYVLRPYPFDRMEFEIASGSAGSAAGQWQMFVEEEGWVYPPIIADTTAGLTQSGYVEWQPLPHEALAAHGDNNLFAMRLIWTDEATIGPTLSLAEVAARGIAPTTNGFAQVLALADGWSLSGDWHQTTSEAAVFDCANNSLLWCLVELAERTGDQWRLARDGTKTIELLRRDRPKSGVAALGWLGVESSDNPEVCALLKLDKAEDYTDEVTRVFPYGAGSGAGRLTLAAATLEMPAGYAMNRDENYIERVNVAQRIEREVVFREIKPVGGAAPAEDEIAANQLALAALHHLQMHDGSVEYVAYSATIAGNHAPLAVGDTIRIMYKDTGLEVDADLPILEANETIDASGVVKTRPTLATLPRLPQSSQSLLAKQVAALSASSGYEQPLPSEAIQRVVRGENIINQIVTSAGGTPSADFNDPASIASALQALGLIKQS